MTTDEEESKDGSDSPKGPCNSIYEELHSTELVTEAASRRVQDMLKKSRESDTGEKLEVNQRLLSSCADLVGALNDLMTQAKDLLEEIAKKEMASKNTHGGFSRP